MATAFQLAINILVPGLLFAAIAAGFSVTYSVTRAQNIAHGALVISAGYVFHALWQRALWHPAAAVAFTLVVAIGLGLAMNTFVFEAMRRRKRGPASWAETLIASFALLILIQNILLATFGAQPLLFRGFRPAIFDVFGAAITSHQLTTMLVAGALLAGLSFFIKFTKTGKAMRAVADHESVAEVIGINSRNIRDIAVVLASAVAGVAGILFALEYNLDPGMPTLTAVRMYFRAIVGGIGSVPGAIVGSLFMESAEQLGSFFWKTAFKDLVAFVLAFVILLWKPKGLFGFRERT